MWDTFNSVKNAMMGDESAKPLSEDNVKEKVAKKLEEYK